MAKTSSPKGEITSSHPNLRVLPVMEWEHDVSRDLGAQIESVLSWETPHQAQWYPIPGRTLLLQTEEGIVKIKGAGFHNPGNVSYSGTNRSNRPVPMGPDPQQPLESMFSRDIVHVDPSKKPPHNLVAAHSSQAPIGGMTLQSALHDQAMFRALKAGQVPSNHALRAYQYTDLNLNGEAMGVSVSMLPHGALPSTAFQPFFAWEASQVDPTTIAFFAEYSGLGESFDYNQAPHRLQVLAKLAKEAGHMLYRFSADADLYRFSGGPDNWNLRTDLDSPLFFSDVDSSKKMADILPEQQAWEVLRNLISGIHNWFYYYLPVLSHSESGYSADSLKEEAHDFLTNMLKGFFFDKSEEQIKELTQKIWSFLTPPMQAAQESEAFSLRKGEHFLEKHYNRPTFHMMMLKLLSPLIQGSEFQKRFPDSNTRPEGIDRFISNSLEHESILRLFTNYSAAQTRSVLAKISHT